MIDAWFNEISSTHFKGMAEEVRYVDDMVFAFQEYDDARRFFDVLPKRLGKYGLNMHESKSRLIRSGQNIAQHEHRKGRRVPTYDFLGFTVYWAKARNGKWWRMKYRSRRDRFSSKLKGLKEFLKTQITTKDTRGVIERVAAVIRGWANYHTISDNEKRVEQFIRISRWYIRNWINRRGRRKPMSWEKFNQLMGRVNFPNKPKTISMFV